MEKKNIFNVLHAVMLLASIAGLLGGCAVVGISDPGPKDLPILQQWSGDYPVADLQKLPEGQRSANTGCITDAVTFAAVAESLDPPAGFPEIDFENNLVVFVRNVDFYNRTTIFKVTMSHGIVDVLAMETMSAIPVEDKAAMAMAVIPRAGVASVRSGVRLIPVPGR